MLKRSFLIFYQFKKELLILSLPLILFAFLTYVAEETDFIYLVFLMYFVASFACSILITKFIHANLSENPISLKQIELEKGEVWDIFWKNLCAFFLVLIFLFTPIIILTLINVFLFEDYFYLLDSLDLSAEFFSNLTRQEIIILFIQMIFIMMLVILSIIGFFYGMFFFNSSIIDKNSFKTTFKLSFQCLRSCFFGFLGSFLLISLPIFFISAFSPPLIEVFVIEYLYGSLIIILVLLYYIKFRNSA